MNPRTDVDSFVCASEDFEEGTSIFDEYVPDQLGAVQRPVQTVASDGLFALATGVMLIRSGIASMVAVEAHSKARERRLARQGGPLRVGSGAEPSPRRSRARRRRPRDAALPARVGPVGRRLRRRSRSATGPRGLEPSRLLRRTPAGADDPLWEPLTVGQTAEAWTGASSWCSPPRTRRGTDAVFVDGVGWNQDAPSLESRDWDRAAAAERAAEQAYARAGVTAGGRRRRRGRRHLRVQAAPAPRGARARRPRPRPRQPLAAARSARVTCTRRTASLAPSRCIERLRAGDAPPRWPSPGAGCPAHRRPSR